ncbi:hypothetical protein BC834DRAFT_942561 [Gloeopeniophorella convolvens]|nr:hypothetical protein BC834DRAFT_942561 [Gloeopeniophorella convolvens]
MTLLSDLNLNLTSHRTQLVLTAACTALATYSLLSLADTRARTKRRAELAADVKRALSSGPARASIPPSPSALPPPEPSDTDASAEELIREQLARNYAFLGEPGAAAVRRATVVVVGCGGVGSWAAVQLARAGVRRLRLVDFDYVTLSSLNRHAAAARADVGTPKVACVARAVGGFAPFVEVEACVALWRGDADGAVLLDGADWVIDAIDNIGTKVELLAHCVRRGIPIFSSMGAGAKSDPTRIQIADLSATHYDPLARAVRQRLRAVLAPTHPQHTYSIPVVYSTEPPSDVRLLPLADAELARGGVDELAPLRDFRVRILPVLGPLPALFGLHAATYVLCALAGRPLERPLPVRHRKKLYERMWKDLLHRESRIARRPINTLPLTTDDIALLLDDFALGRSVLPPCATCARPTLVRWDPRAPLSLENCVVAEMRDAERAVREVFGVPGEGGPTTAPASGPPSGLVDATGEPVQADGEAWVETRTPEEVWGAEAAHVAQLRIAQARQFREWSLQR